MKPRALFEVLTRSIGLLQIAGGVALLPTTVQSVLPYSNERELFLKMMAGALTMSGMEIILGCLLLFGARWISDLFFPKDTYRGDDTQHRDESAPTGAEQDSLAVPTRKFEMRAEALFGVAVRVIGVWNIAYGLWWIPGVGILLYDLSQVYPDPTFQEALWRELGSSAFRFTVGMALFFNADRIVGWAYLPPAVPPNAAG
jgi:hypothetical protein